jgi:uncharacterized protein DUF2330
MRRTLPSTIRYLLAVLLFLEPSTALADDKIFSAFNHQASIPDQQALIAFKDGIETLAIETRFTGTGTDFAWVVPLPAPPEISRATTGLFPSLRAIMAPRLETGGGGIGLLLLMLVGLIAAVDRAKGCLTKAVVAMLVGFTLVVLVLLPSLGKARGAAPVPGVTVLDRQVVGSFETTTITGATADPLLAWLETNGFEQPAAAKPVIAEYAARGWCFVAARLRRTETGGTATPHPLVFKFPTIAPVYPLKLTGVDSGPVTVELYIFGAGTAAVPGFKVIRSMEVSYQESKPWDYARVDAITHRSVLALANGLPVATCLKGRLSPQQMAVDATITFGPPVARRATFYSRAGAWGAGFDAAMASFCVATLLLSISLAIRTRTNPSTTRPARYAAAIGLMIGVGVVAWLPTVPVTRGHGHWIAPFRLRTLGESVAIEYEKAKRDSGGRPLDLAWARSVVAGFMAEHWDGIVPREEDSPGNYTLAQVDGGLEFRFYDWNGREGLVTMR